ncbi:hypothetical protein [Streptomyces sp. NBC_01615]|uniref:hypothetical protein n=1 Tax=Streptomyces sp. NBC_01615 TaxID=2975898 RepID=UPI0038694743
MNRPYYTGTPLLPAPTTGVSLTAASHTHLAAGPDATTTLLLGVLSALVGIGIAVTGWTLIRIHRRHDHDRADLTEASQLLRRLYVQIQTLADEDGVATGADFVTLRAVKYELRCVTTPTDPDLNTALVNVTSCLEAFFSTALPAAATGPGTLQQARQQGRAAQEVLTAVQEAQAAVQRLRRR